MAASIKNIRKLAQVLLRDKGFYSGDIDGLWGTGSNAAFDDYSRFLRGSGLEIGDEDAIVEDATVKGITGVVVLDPGHGGDSKIGGSSANNATSASGVPEKTMTLELAKLVRKELNKISSGRPGSDIKVHLTRAKRQQSWTGRPRQSCAVKGRECVCQHSLQRLRREGAWYGNVNSVRTKWKCEPC